MKNRRIMLLGIGAALAQMLSTTAFAIEESDVEAAINASSAEVVSGNVFIWFLCALAFLKISQKIDSFMSSLGVNVGRTGGSMLGELMIAGRALGAAAKATGGAIGNLFGGGRGGQAGGQSGQTAQQAAGENLAHGKGLAGIAMSAAAPAAVASLTGKGKAGIRNTVVGSMVDSSINSGGQFAASVVGAIAKGNYSRDGSITGERAAQALTSYLGYQATGTVAGTEGAPIPTTSIPSNDGTGASSDVSRPGEDVVTMEGGTSAAAMAAGMGIGSSQEVGHTPTPSDGSVTSKLNSGTAPIGSKPPTFSDVEIGGGRITGYEAPAGGGEERQFAMYSASQYMQPSGPYETVQTVDGESWYKQYAQPTVQKTPHEGKDGKIEYSSHIVAELPPVPKRKDRI